MAKKRVTKRTVAPKKSIRVHIPATVELEVLTRCRRHCCMCYGLDKKLGQTEGQIAHLDRDPSNCGVDNLAFLCLVCHKKYDTKNNRVIGFNPGELRVYREELFRALNVDQVQWTITVTADKK